MTPTTIFIISFKKNNLYNKFFIQEYNWDNEKVSINILI